MFEGFLAERQDSMAILEFAQELGPPRTVLSSLTQKVSGIFGSTAFHLE